jgi:transposase
MLLVGYFEDLDSQRGIAWRCADGLSLRQFLGVGLDARTPDHSTLTNTRNRLPKEVFGEVFQFVLRIAAGKKLIDGKTVGVDSTTLEANAAMKSIVHRDTGEDWNGYVTRLMREDGTIVADAEPTDEEIRRYDKQRKNKRVSNDDWQSPTDPESRITKLKDGRTHLAYKAEHVVDLQSDLVLAAEVYQADQADTDTLADSVLQAQINLDEADSDARIEEAVADKGYHAARTLELCQWMGLRTYVPEPRRVHSLRWTDKPPEHRQAVLANRRRTKRAKSKRWQRLRSERCERTFAHVCDSGGMRRSWLRGVDKLTKRYLIAVAAHNLGRILRTLFGIGKPKALQGYRAVAALVYLAIHYLQRHLAALKSRLAFIPHALVPTHPLPRKPVTSTGCYGSLRRLGRFLFLTLCVSFVAAVAQLTLGLIEQRWAIWIAMGLAIAAGALFVLTLFIVRSTMRGWVAYLEEKADKRQRERKAATS